MSSIGSPIHTSLVQAAQAQQNASKAKDREKAVAEQVRREQDRVELRVAGVEAADALRKLPSNDSEQAEDEHHRQAQARAARHRPHDRDGEESIDLKA